MNLRALTPRKQGEKQIPSPRRGGLGWGEKLWILAAVALILPACGLLSDTNDDWPYAQTPIPPNTDDTLTVITVGDSIAAGWMDCRETICEGIEFDWWQDAIGGEALVFSRGIGNSTTDDLLENWSRDTAGADVVIVLTGVNDVARGVDAEHITANFEQMTARAHENGITPVISTIMPADTTTPEQQAVVEAVNEFLRSQDDWLVMDLSSEMSDPDNPGRLRRDEIAHDGSAHPNERGYARMTAFVRAWWMENFP